MTETPEVPSTISDEQISQLIGALISRAQDLADACDTGTLLQPVTTGSALAIADAKTKPYQLSHTAQGLIVSSVEHLTAIADLVEHAPSLHGKPLFTLARSAVESAAISHWICTDQPDDERLRSFATLEAQDAKDEAAVFGLVGEATGSDLSKDVAKRDAHVVALLASLDLKKGSPFSTTRVLKAFDSRVANDPHPAKFETFWRSSSGLAHARTWAARALLIAEPTSKAPGDDDTVTVKFVNRADRLAWLMALTIESIGVAVTAYNEAASEARG